MRRIVMAVMIVASSSAGCVAETEPAPVDCSPMVGPYVAHYVERPGGGCGRLTDQVIAFSATPQPPPDGCTGRTFGSADGCQAGVELKCGDSSTTMLCKRQTNGATCVVTNLSPECISTYDVTMTR